MNLELSLLIFLLLTSLIHMLLHYIQGGNMLQYFLC